MWRLELLRRLLGNENTTARIYCNFLWDTSTFFGEDGSWHWRGQGRPASRQKGKKIHPGHKSCRFIDLFIYIYFYDIQISCELQFKVPKYIACKSATLRLSSWRQFEWHVWDRTGHLDRCKRERELGMNIWTWFNTPLGEFWGVGDVGTLGFSPGKGIFHMRATPNST